MTAVPAPTRPTTIVVYRKRRIVELLLVLLATGIAASGFVSAALNIYGHLPSYAIWVILGWILLGLVLHVLVRIRWSYADPTILPIALLLNGLGLSMIWRIDQINNPVTSGSTTQFIWTVLGMIGFGVVAITVRDYRVLQRFPYLLFCIGIALLLLPLIPGIGVELNGARIWISIAGFSFQPAEIAKIVLVLAFASYLADKREVLALAGRNFLGIDLPRPRDLGPILIMWAASIIILVFQNDFGTSLLFFGMFVLMIYVATEKPSWPILGFIMFTAAALAVFFTASHVKVRVQSWLDPFSNYDQNYQIIQAQYGFAWGGLTGRGWGLGRPGLTPLARSDMIPAAIGEELGLLGLFAVIVLFAILVTRGMKAALSSPDPYGKLLAVGLSFVMALQVFAIIGGVTRLLPLTGLTTPFMSQGGSSMVSNWIIIALLMGISHQARRPMIPTTVEPSGATDLAEDETAVISL